MNKKEAMRLCQTDFNLILGLLKRNAPAIQYRVGHYLNSMDKPLSFESAQTSENLEVCPIALERIAAYLYQENLITPGGVDHVS